MESVQRQHFVGFQIVSVVFHRIGCVFSIVDGLFVGRIISVVIDCCIKNIISIVNNVEYQEKTCLRQPGQPP
jgi:hypothetical protein